MLLMVKEMQCNEIKGKSYLHASDTQDVHLRSQLAR